MSMTEITTVTIPHCDVCKDEGVTRPAFADAKLGAGMPWGNVCVQHFTQFDCKLGTGYGQRFVLKESE